MTHRRLREADAELRASEERYRELFENANDIVFTVDLAGNFTSINRAGERLSGYHRDQVLSMNVAAIVAPEYLEAVRRAGERKLSGGEDITSYEVELLTRSGRRLPVEISTRLIHQDGKPIGVQGIARDITERKLAEQALRRMNARLEEQAGRIARALHDEAGQLLGERSHVGGLARERLTLEGELATAGAIVTRREQEAEERRITAPVDGVSARSLRWRWAP
jgi:PAS domain S-box-containing protein